MDPFRYHDSNELEPFLYNSASVEHPMSHGNLNYSNAQNYLFGPLMLPRTAKEKADSTLPHLIKTRHTLQKKVPNRPVSNPVAIPHSRATFIKNLNHAVETTSSSAPCSFSQEWSDFPEAHGSINTSPYLSASAASSSSNSLSGNPLSPSSSPPSSFNENGVWRRRTISQNSLDLSSPSSNGFKPCSLCKKNGERPKFYNSHRLHSFDNGSRRVECPILRSVQCSICGATGDGAHTLSHCPNSADKVPVALMVRNTARQCNGSFRKRFD